MRMTLFRYVTLALLTSFIVGTIGCSKSGSSGKNGKGLSENDLASFEDRLADGSIPTAEGEGLFRDIRFDYDSSEVGDEARQDIDYNLEILKSYPNVNLVLEGHCDERGTAEYNMALGNARAQGVERILRSYGIPAERLRTISYGEEVPLDQNHDEAAWAKNRRVHFAPTNG
jgi:peptidoglycan-associated lipoprotein